MKSIRLVIAFLLLFVAVVPANAELKTFIKEYTYQASEDDSKNSSRIVAIREVKRLLLEEIGTYLESITEVINFQLTKDQITALTAGIIETKILDEKWDGKVYWIKTKIDADREDVINSIDKLRKDRDKSKELEEIKARSDELLQENRRLRVELSFSKKDDKSISQQKYNETIKGLSAQELIESAKKKNFNKQYNDVIDDMNKALQLNSNNSNAFMLRGNAYKEIRKYNEAITDFNKAIEIRPSSSVAFNLRGLSYFGLQKDNEAIADFSKAIELDVYKNDFNLFRNRAITFLRMKKSQEAIDDANRAIQLSPDYDAKLGMIKFRAVSYLSINKVNEAIEDLNMYLEKNHNDGISFLARSWAFYSIGKYNEAVIDAGKRVKINPDESDGYLCRATSYTAMNEFDNALQDLKNAFQIKPSLINDVRTDRRFDKIRSNKDFKKLMEQ